MKQKDICVIKEGDLIYDGVRYKKVEALGRDGVLLYDSWQTYVGKMHSYNFVSCKELENDNYKLIN